MPGSAICGLERSCAGHFVDWIRIAPPCDGVERAEAFFAGHAFAPHRHDTYAMGVTLSGVQAFYYRGAAERSLPGQVFVLHPDERHDGHAGTDGGFRYRILYIEPRAIQDALGEGLALPFLQAPVSSDCRLTAAMQPALEDLDEPLEELQRDQIVLDIAEALAAADHSFGARKLTAPHWHSVRRARDFLDAASEIGVTSAALEQVAGLSRFALARHFRICFGTSPYRYHVLRRLDRARALIHGGAALADAAVASGFADQSHMTRQFKRTFGLTPGRYAALVRPTHPDRT